jgi:hypothetical protein
MVATRAFARFMSYFYSTVDPSFVAFKKKIFGDIVKEKPRRPGSSELRILEVGVGTGKLANYCFSQYCTNLTFQLYLTDFN